MENAHDPINRFPSERFDPASALLEVLEKVERFDERFQEIERENLDLKNQIKDMKEELERKSESIFWMKQKLFLLLPDSELRGNRREVLEALLAKHGGQMAQKKAAEIMGISKYTMSRLLKSVVGTIGVYNDPNDQRSGILFLKDRKLVAATNATISPKSKLTK